MSEETKQVWDNLFQKLNEKEKTFLAVVNNEKNKEIERLHSIIKEVREYITSQKLHKFQDTTGGLTYKERKLLEILDKVGDKE